MAQSAVQRDAESRLHIHVVNLKALAANPSNLNDGDMWYFDDGGTRAFRGRVNGATVAFTVA